MGELAKLLTQPTAVEPENRETTFDGDGNYTQARVMEKQPETPHELLEFFGHDPKAFAVDGNITIGHRELADGRTLSRYAYKLRPAPEQVDLDDLLTQVEKAEPAEPVHASGSGAWFVFQAGDLQLGKRARDGGTEEIIRAFKLSVDNAVEELLFAQDYTHIDGVQLAFVGDCMEGVVSQGGKNLWLTSETITEQTRIFRRLLLWTVDQFRHHVPKVYLDVVNGNHDEAQRMMNTKPGDGWATECAIAVDDAMSLNLDAYSTVEVRVPNEWSGNMTVPVGDSLVTLAHGHQWRRGKGMTWWAEQSLNKQPAAHSSVLQHGHVHTYEIETTRDRTRISSPTFDPGSDWFREAHGGDAKVGGLTYLLLGGEISRVSLV
ncbi:MRE11 double-strand break endo/exonuclease [Gordonia phage Trax]|uniref:MRE11 double-strand break endo/exonuclease n=1 Tax=Gordonia phage Trax TaxID=2591121 RepID=A0A515MH39_9CAUD|nr:exonuclease [Gordonia phage Trax]QDM55995.1 MRE11 double-strand break endo/exonuclease [Gordonia phage Trax]